MSKYSHFEMCEKIFGDRYKWDEHKQECTLFTRSDMWDKLVEQQQQIAELQKQLKEKEKEIEDLKRKVNCYVDYVKNTDMRIKLDSFIIKELQDKLKS